MANRIYHDMRKWWPSLRNDLAHHVGNCDSCQRYTIVKKGYHPYQSQQADLPLDLWQLDLIELPVSRQGYRYGLVIIDLFTSYVITRPLKSKTAEEVAHQLLTIFGDWGPPKAIQSDQGKEFVNQVLEALLQITGVKFQLSSPYHHESNGRVERLNQTIARSLKKMLKGNLTNWDTILPLATHYYNISVRTLTKSSPYSLMFTRPHNDGQSLATATSQWVANSNSFDEWVNQHQPNVLRNIYPAIMELHQTTREKQGREYNAKHNIVPALEVGTRVMARNMTGSKHEQDWLGPYRIDKILPTGSYILTDNINKDIRRARQDIKVLTHSDPEPEEEKVFEVEHIRQHRGKPRSYEYLVKWRGFDEKDNTWEPERNFHDKHIVSQYWKQLTHSTGKRKEIEPAERRIIAAQRKTHRK